jgi:hypothetical protein
LLLVDKSNQKNGFSSPFIVAANFLNKVVENQKIDYQFALRKEKVFFIDYIKPIRPIPEVTNVPKDDHTEEVEITDTQQQ